MHMRLRGSAGVSCVHSHLGGRHSVAVPCPPAAEDAYEAACEYGDYQPRDGDSLQGFDGEIMGGFFIIEVRVRIAKLIEGFAAIPDDSGRGVGLGIGRYRLRVLADVRILVW